MQSFQPLAPGNVMTSAVADGAALRGDWFGQPKGLTVLFLTEMWEKFSFYGMRVLQVYYMTKQLRFSQGDASLIFGIYSAGVYLTPILGGYLADRWMGRRRAVVIGGVLMAIGHFMMTWESLFFAAMVLIAAGNGLFLPNLPSQVPSLYEAGDPRRSGAFNIYYAGVNLGGLLAPLVCGTLGELYGWHYGFGAAGVGMCLGLLVYVAGSRYLPKQPSVTATPPDAIAVGPSSQRSFRVLLAVGLAVVVYRTSYEQIGNTFALWSDTEVDRSLFHAVIPVTSFQALNPLFVFMLTPFLVAWWKRSAAKGNDLPPIHKMALGALGMAVSYALLAALSHADASLGQKTAWPWLVVFFFLFTASELFILPVGLGLFASLAPARLGATVIAAWFLASFAGNLLAGVVGTGWSHATPMVFFAGIAAIAALSSALLYASQSLNQRTN